MVPRAPITTRTVVVLSPHIRSTSISKSLYLLSFSVVLTEVLVSRGVVMSMRRQALSFLFFSTMSGLLAAVVLSVCIGMSHRLFNIIIIIIIIIITVIIIKVLIIHLLSYLIIIVLLVCEKIKVAIYTVDM